MIGEETKEAKDYEESIEVEERFGNDIDRNLRELEALGWFGFDQVSKEIIRSLTEGGEVSFIWEGSEVRLEICETSYNRQSPPCSHGTTAVSESV